MQGINESKNEIYSSPENRVIANTITSNIEECSLAKDNDIDFPLLNTKDHYHSKLAIGESSTNIEGLTSNYSKKRFFKSSQKRRINLRGAVTQESLENTAGLDVTKDELFYPDCNMSKIMSIENGQIKVKREWKKMFKVVDHVRESHLIQEIGEDQEVKDDLEYLMDGLTGEHSLKVKVHSALGLVKKSVVVEFRSYLRSTHSTLDLIRTFDDFQSNQKLSVCFCSLMMIMIKCYPREEDNAAMIDQLLILRDTAYPIPDRDMLKMIETLRDSCNNVKGRNASKAEILLLSSRDFQVSTLVEIIICILSSRDERYLKDPRIIKVLLDSVQNHLCELMDTLDKDPSEVGEMSCKLHLILSLLSKWLQTENEETIGEFIKKEIIHDLLRSCCSCIKVFLPAKSKRSSKLSENVDINFINIFIDILQCLGLVVLKGKREHLSVFQNDSMEQLIFFILFLGSRDEIPQYFDLLVLCLEMTINLIRFNREFSKHLTENLSVKPSDSSYKTCKSGLQCLAKLFHRNHISLKYSEAIEKRKQSQVKESRVSYPPSTELETELDKEQTFADSFISENTNNTSLCLSLSGRKVENSMNTFIISSYIAALVGVIISQTPKMANNILHLIPNGSFMSICGVLEDFTQFISECNLNHCHDFLSAIIEFLKSMQNI